MEGTTIGLNNPDKGAKPDPRRPNELRINRRIRVKEVFVIAADGNKLGVMPTEDAFKRAMEEGLDLVEVNPMSRPPVCKIMDYGKYKYDQKKKAGAARKNQKVIEIKEVKLRPKTDDHDFNFKMDHTRRFLAEGNKAKITIMFRGREITHPEIGRSVLERVVDALKDVAMVELPPRMEGRNMFMVLTPAKPGQKPMGAPGQGFPAPAPSSSGSGPAGENRPPMGPRPAFAGNPRPAPGPSRAPGMNGPDPGGNSAQVNMAPKNT